MAKRKKQKTPKMTKKSSNPGTKELKEVPISKIPPPQDLPVYDYLKDYDLNTDWGVAVCLDDLIISLEEGYFFRWEAVVCQEQGLTLTKKQQEALAELINFSDDEDELILYINELPRPSQPWYEIINQVVPKLLLEPFVTSKIYEETYHEGWPRLVDCLENYAQDLSLPQGITSPLEVIPAGIRHRLWLQSCCFDELSGLGQEEELTLENEEQKSWRIEEFIDSLKDYKDSVNYCHLTLDKLLQLVKLPPKDEKILVKSMLEKLGLESGSQQLYNFL